MAFQRIRIKNSSVAGKIPDASALDPAELAINLKDQKLFSKDADGNVFELGGKVESGPTPPTNGNETGDLFWDGDFLLVWNGTEWVPVGQSDLDYTAAPDKGTITNTNGDDAEIPLVDETNAGLMSPADYSKLDGMTSVIAGPNQPGTPSLGDIWVDTSDCPPTINIWDDCEDPGNPTWTPIGGGGTGGCVQGPVTIISSNGNEIGATLTATGGNGTDEGSGLFATYAWTGAKTGTGATIVADVEGDYTVTASVTCVDGSVLGTTATWTVSDSYVDMVNNTPPVIAVVGGGVDEAYEGNSIYVVTNATVVNGENPVIVENQWFKDGTADGTDQIYTIGADDEGAVITCKQLFRDDRTNELLSEASNSITIVARPADAIGFTPVITDDGTPTGNQVGKTLTAAALNITGGVAAQEYAFQWYADNVAEIGAQGKTKEIIASDVGKTITCDVTVAEPDGTNPETRTAIYNKVPEVAGTINKPTVLAPSDGAGSGVSRPIVTDEITAIEGGGIKVCETELIESVDITTDAPNVVLTFPSAQGFDCFEPGDVVQGSTLTFDSDFAEGSTAVDFVDGSTATETVVSLNPFIATFNPPLPWNTKIEIYTKSGAGDQGGFFSVNGGPEVTVPNHSWGDITPPGETSGTISTIYMRNGSYPDVPNQVNRFTALRINGTIVNDPSLAGPAYKVISKDDSDPFTITVDGGAWTGTDGSNSGDAADQEDKLVKETPYDTKLTLAGAKDLDVLEVGNLVKMGMDADVPYQPVSDSIVTVTPDSPSTGEITLILSDKTDLAYFRPGDVVQTGVSIVSIDDSVPSITVDGGNWDTSNQSEVWSDFTTVSDGASSSNPITNLYDGDLSTYCFGSQQEGTIVLSGINIPYTKSIRIYSGSNGLSASVNGATPPVDVSGADQWHTVVTGSGTLTNLTITAPVGYTAAAAAIEIDDKLLVDQGITAPGDTEVTCISPLKAPTDWTVEAIEGNTLSLSHATPDDNAQVWVANDNQAGTDFFVTGPNYVDEPLVTADVELKSSLFATTPADADTLKNIVWELNGAEQNAGTSNPYKPTGIAVNTTYTVRVKHQGNALEDSPWSDSTTFTTGPTRNLYTYYKERVELLESRLSSIEADEVNDDATDTLLINTVADLIQRVEQLEGGA